MYKLVLHICVLSLTCPTQFTFSSINSNQASAPVGLDSLSTWFGFRFGPFHQRPAKQWRNLAAAFEGRSRRIPWLFSTHPKLLKHTRDADDDRIAFLEAVRAASLLPENKSPPTL
ncbi:hypothetical protein SDJN02_18560, partial [Cucurbita argyrosperma subsp. argyrosperma]